MSSVCPSESLNQFDTGKTGRLWIGHHMSLTDLHHIFSVEHTAYLHLMLNCPLASRPHFSG
jgi:hypothetical protein